MSSKKTSASKPTPSLQTNSPAFSASRMLTPSERRELERDSAETLAEMERMGTKIHRPGQTTT